MAGLVFSFLLYSSSIVFHSNWRVCLNLRPSSAKLSFSEIGVCFVASFANLSANLFPTISVWPRTHYSVTVAPLLTIR